MGFISEETTFFINVQKILLQKMFNSQIHFISPNSFYLINFSSFLASGKLDFIQMVAIDQFPYIRIHNNLQNLSMVSVIPRVLCDLRDSCTEFIYFIPLKPLAFIKFFSGISGCFKISVQLFLFYCSNMWV